MRRTHTDILESRRRKGDEPTFWSSRSKKLSYFQPCIGRHRRERGCSQANRKGGREFRDPPRSESEWGSAWVWHFNEILRKLGKCQGGDTGLGALMEKSKYLGVLLLDCGVEWERTNVQFASRTDGATAMMQQLRRSVLKRSEACSAPWPYLHPGHELWAMTERSRSGSRRSSIPRPRWPTPRRGEPPPWIERSTLRYPVN